MADIVSLALQVYIFVYCLGTTGSAVSGKQEMNVFECMYDENISTLRIESGKTDAQIVECLKTYNSTEKLILSNSHLRSIPKYLNILGKLVYLDLSKNDITNVSFVGIENICQQLTYLSLNFNNINVLRKGNFDCLHSLNYLYLGNNQLEVIENGTFNEQMKNIEYIYLVNNSLTFLDFSIVCRLKLSDDVRITINASWNFIRGITNSVNLTINDFTSKTRVGVVATHNNFTSFDIKDIFKLLNISNPFQLYNLWNCGFDVRFNPFICNCALFPLADALRKFRHMDPDNPLFSITCKTPSSLEGMMLREVPKNQFNCTVDLDCPDTCVCIKTVALDLVTVNCNDKYIEYDLPRTCPTAEKINLNIKSGMVTKLSSREYLLNVSRFDVSLCAIKNIDTSFIDMIKKTSISALFLNNNRLQKIPRSFERFNFSKGQVLALDGNPFKCDCHTRWMKEWLRSNKMHILRLQNILCASGPGKDKSIIDVPDNMFVCQPLTVIDEIYIVIGSLSLLSILVIIVACRYKSIQLLMISHFDVCKFCCRRRKQRRFHYDIFIPHSCEDDDVIEKVIHYLENHQPPYKVCIGEKNFKPGNTISENILDAIDSSHTTLLVISNNFLRSSWCNMEFREAHMRFLRDRNINMVMIVLEELDTSLICKELKLYMDTHVYIKYWDTQFWAKLLQNLPIMIEKSITERSSLISNDISS